jgi:hypothetical protein
MEKLRSMCLRRSMELVEMGKQRRCGPGKGLPWYSLSETEFGRYAEVLLPENLENIRRDWLGLQAVGAGNSEGKCLK